VALTPITKVTLTESTVQVVLLLQREELPGETLEEHWAACDGDHDPVALGDELAGI
jgi:hypothetical protein